MVRSALLRPNNAAAEAVVVADADKAEEAVDHKVAAVVDQIKPMATTIDEVSAEAAIHVPKEQAPPPRVADHVRFLRVARDPFHAAIQIVKARRAALPPENLGAGGRAVTWLARCPSEFYSR